MHSLSQKNDFRLILSKEGISKFLLYLTFFFLCTTFNLFNLEGRNILLLVTSVLAFIIIINFDIHLVPKRNVVLVLAGYLCLSFLLNVTTSKATSFIYSLFFLFNFWFLSGYFRKYLTIEDYNSILKYTFITYFIILLLGQLYLYFGFFPHGKISETGVTHGSFGTLFETGKDSYRFYSLSTEPSCASFIVIILFYSILKTSPKNGFSKEKIIYWLLLIYMIVFFKSGYGLLLMAMLLGVHLKKTKHVVAVISVIIILIPILVVFKTSAFTRVSAIIMDLDWTNIFSLTKIDYSASFRILPFFYYLKDINLLDIHFYIGHGAGSSVGFLVPLLFNVPVRSYEGGFLPQFLYDYGILLVPVLLFFLRSEVIEKFFSFEMAVILLMMTNANFNTQLFWVTIICFALNRLYIGRYSNA